MRLFKKSFLISILILFMVIFQGCPWDYACDSTIHMVNKSNKTLQFYFDTSLIIQSETLRNSPNSVILPFSARDACDWWIKMFKNEISICHLFLFDKAVVDSVPWDTIRVHNMYVKHFDFNRATLDSLNWNLTYP
jgi:hypothetical protein